MKPTIGIIGGSGPLATLDIEQKILRATQKIRGVLTDQDYFNLVTLNYASTYDRNDSVCFGQLDPLGQYLEYLLSITTLGIDLILIGCNTAHMYLSHLEHKINVPIISIIDSTLAYLKTKAQGVSRVGLISTKATRDKKLYHSVFFNQGIEVVDVSESTQHSIMEAIYLIKAGVPLDSGTSFTKNHNKMTNLYQYSSLKNHPYKKILLHAQPPNPTFIVKRAIKELEQKGCEHIIFGCTELPLVIPYLCQSSNLSYVDPNDIVAEEAVKILVEVENRNCSFSEIPMNEIRCA